MGSLFWWLMALIMAVGCDQNQDTKDDEDEPYYPYFHDRSRFKDPDFEGVYTTIGTLKVRQEYGSFHKKYRDMDIRVAHDGEYVFLMLYSPYTGYVLNYFLVNDRAQQFVFELDECAEWVRSAEKYDYERRFYERHTEREENYLSLVGEKESAHAYGSCMILMTDFRERPPVPEKWLYKVKLTPHNAWDLKIDLEEALRDFVP